MGKNFSAVHSSFFLRTEELPPLVGAPGELHFYWQSFADTPVADASGSPEKVLKVDMAPGSLNARYTVIRRKPGFGSMERDGFLPRRYRSPGGPHRRPPRAKGVSPSCWTIGNKFDVGFWNKESLPGQ